ncbi:ABC-three component system protein [Amphritea pacifica]|uniref:ABC-three component systems C-terminal domain-containing protein n=1 Tax=Amphritea pacifica TaxID=2811233 RepID=A0ABS2WCP8_9GAMM|nr:ABC-three component system protein [Amphritea pacifica]MBN0989361.1 hypothetical protein [Amphritea pacifica]
MADTSQFDASASMLGYLYQVRFGLYMAWKKLPEVDDPERYHVSIEKLDDISFEQDGTATELLQTKYHCTPGNLTNRSPDIWKTIRVWVESYQAGTIELGNALLTLITTQNIPEGTIACYLGTGLTRDTAAALEIMEEISSETNQTNAKGYTAFQDLSSPQKQALLDSVYIVGQSDDFQQISTRLRRYGRQSVPSECVEAFVNRIEGIWFTKCVELLSQTPTGVITLSSLEELIDEIRPEYTHTNLPAEFSDALPDVIDLDSDLRTFIQQLRLFTPPKGMLEQAITNYFRAFEQRTKWSSDGLLQPGELGRYDRKIQEQWQEHQGFIELMADITTEEGKRKYAAQLYQQCIQHGVIPIRQDFNESYVAKGSYHLLSDKLTIGWHPDYLECLDTANDEGVA